jgi:FHS family L-fucose permease-like MFS transporter
VRIRHWRWAVLAQFCYVGAQTACWSYLIRYAIEEIPGMTPGFAANYLTGTMVCFFIGRFTGTWLIRRFAPHKVLAAYALLAMLLCLISAFSGGHVGLLALTLCSAFMSIQYPTIFSLGIKNLGRTPNTARLYRHDHYRRRDRHPGDGLCQRRRRQYPHRRTGPGAVLCHHLYFCPFPFASGTN